jgi:hypothetical protein
VHVFLHAVLQEHRFAGKACRSLESLRNVPPATAAAAVAAAAHESTYIKLLSALPAKGMQRCCQNEKHDTLQCCGWY